MRVCVTFIHTHKMTKNTLSIYLYSFSICTIFSKNLKRCFYDRTFYVINVMCDMPPQGWVPTSQLKKKYNPFFTSSFHHPYSAHYINTRRFQPKISREITLIKNMDYYICFTRNINFQKKKYYKIETINHIVQFCIQII